MIKRVVGLLILGLSVGLCYGGESFTFVTSLSAPVGTFATLETADPNSQSTSSSVNFCSGLVSTGTIILSGRKAPWLKKITLSKNATLSSEDMQEVQANRVDISEGGVIIGKSLLANQLQVQHGARITVANTMYVPRVTAQVGIAKGLIIGDPTAPEVRFPTAVGVSPGRKEFFWTNNLQADHTSNGLVNQDNYKSQYLLQSKTMTERSPGIGPGGGGEEPPILPPEQP